MSQPVACLQGMTYHQRISPWLTLKCCIKSHFHNRLLPNPSCRGLFHRKRTPKTPVGFRGDKLARLWLSIAGENNARKREKDDLPRVKHVHMTLNRSDIEKGRDRKTPRHNFQTPSQLTHVTTFVWLDRALCYAMFFFALLAPARRSYGCMHSSGRRTL